MNASTAVIFTVGSLPGSMVSDAKRLEPSAAVGMRRRTIPAGVVADMEVGYGREKLSRVGSVGRVEELFAICKLDDLPRLQDEHAVADRSDDGEVMRDEQHRQRRRPP